MLIAYSGAHKGLRCIEKLLLRTRNHKLGFCCGVGSLNEKLFRRTTSL